MEQILHWGLDVVLAVQSAAHPALTLLMKVITFCGSEYFYLLIIPFLYWCVDEKKGMRFGLSAILSGYTNEVLKGLVMQPRPYDLKPEVGMVHEESSAFPSGHSQNSVVFFGLLADFLPKRLGRILAVLMPLLIGFSRVYLGAHFPTDVLAGWAAGLLFLLLCRKAGPWIEKRLSSLSILRRLALVILTTAVMVITSKRDISLAGVFLGAGIGFIFRTERGKAGGLSPAVKALRYLLGIVVAAGLYLGLKTLFPGPESGLYVPLRFLRYGVIGFWVSFGAPRLFSKVKLA